MLKIRTGLDPALRNKTDPITTFGKPLYGLVRDLFKIMEEYEGVGLAANQVGIMKSIFVYRWEEREGVVCNPSFVNHASGLTEGIEGCLSLPGEQYIVPRFTDIMLKGQDIEGKPIDESAIGFIARIYQHEMDHLRGITINQSGNPW